MSRLKNKEFHVSFIKSLVFVGLVTIVAMASAHIFIPKLYSEAQKNQEYTSQQSQYQQNTGENQLIRPSSH